MDVKTVMIVVTFCVGIVLILVAVVALFRRVGGKQGGSLSFLGATVSGSSAPALFLVVGAVLALAGFGWASSQADVKKANADLVVKEKAVKDAKVETEKATDEKRRAVEALAVSERKYQEQVAISRMLVEKAPTAVHQLPPHIQSQLKDALMNH